MSMLGRAIGRGRLDFLLAACGGVIPNVKSIDAVEAVRLGASLAARRRRGGA
jgi:hypothetical protein